MSKIFDIAIKALLNVIVNIKKYTNFTSTHQIQVKCWDIIKKNSFVHYGPQNSLQFCNWFRLNLSAVNQWSVYISICIHILYLQKIAVLAKNILLCKIANWQLQGYSRLQIWFSAKSNFDDFRRKRKTEPSRPKKLHSGWAESCARAHSWRKHKREPLLWGTSNNNWVHLKMSKILTGFKASTCEWMDFYHKKCLMLLSLASLTDWNVSVCTLFIDIFWEFYWNFPTNIARESKNLRVSLPSPGFINTL